VRLAALISGLVVTTCAFAPLRALETDQFYAWNRPLEDSTRAINEKLNADIAAALDRVNARRGNGACPCREARNAIRDQFYYLIFGRLELWASKASVVDRIPKTDADEALFRRRYLYHETSPFDPIRWMPLSPTIEIRGIRIGTDKLGHFFSDGAWIEEPYRRALAKGATDEEALRRSLRFSLVTERTILGMGSSGVFSLADSEANYQGLLFYRGLCSGPNPALVPTPSGWSLRRPFDIGDYVSPEWDESWQPNIYSPLRWAKVRPVMRRYCGLLQDPVVRRRRAEYASRDRETPTEAIVNELVAAGKLPDPRQFTIEAACASASEPSVGSGR
jgi:hypothetical protein